MNNKNFDDEECTSEKAALTDASRSSNEKYALDSRQAVTCSDFAGRNLASKLPGFLSQMCSCLIFDSA